MSNTDSILISVVIGLVFVGGFVAGVLSQDTHIEILTNYCASKNSEYVEVVDIRYCKKGNQLTKIEWLNKN